jgi:hypothetical protein
MQGHYNDQLGRRKAKRYKQGQATYEIYDDQALHKLTKRIVTALNSFLDDGGRIKGMLGDVSILNNLDMECVEKIIFALSRAKERLVEALQLMGVKIEIYEKSTDMNLEESMENKPSEEGDSPGELAEDMSESDA